MVKTYDEWKLKIPANIDSLNRSNRMAWNAKYQSVWKKDFPWLIEVKVNNRVVGVLCSVCRDGFCEESKEQLRRSGGKFVTVPFVKFGDLRTKVSVINTPLLCLF